MLTTEEKIEALIYLRVQNRNYNLFTPFIYKSGLCSIYRHYHKSQYGSILRIDIPELFNKKMKGCHELGYWWPITNKLFGIYSWWYRHRAINKTIKELKKQLCKK